MSDNEARRLVTRGDTGLHSGHLMLLDAAVTALLMTHPRPDHLRRDFTAITDGLTREMLEAGIPTEVIEKLETKRQAMIEQIGRTAVRSIKP